MNGVNDTEVGFTRARRNLVLLSTFLILIALNVITFKDEMSLLGIAAVKADQLRFQIALTVFQIYFIWRFSTANNSSAFSFFQCVKADTYRHTQNKAEKRFKQLRSALTLIQVERKFGPFTVPRYELRTSTVLQGSYELKHHWDVPVICYLLLSINNTFKRVITDNYFTEVLLPYILGSLALGLTIKNIITLQS